MKIFTVAKGSTGFDGLKRGERDEPTPGPGQALVRMRAASLNFRDLAIVSGKYVRGPVTHDTIPLSDGAGEVVALGAGVRSLKVGDRVVATFNQGRPPNSLGSPLDGVLTEFAAFDEDGLLKIPPHMSFEEASTLPCAGVTAWNALMHGKTLRAGETVLTLGTGGVSIVTLQLAKIAGARVIITSSSDEKLERARQARRRRGHQLQAASGLGEEGARAHGRAGRRSCRRARRRRHAAAFVSGGRLRGRDCADRRDDAARGRLAPYPLMFKGATLRGIFVGAREHFEGLMRAVAVNELKPVIDRMFAFDQAVEAYSTSSRRSTSARS